MLHESAAQESAALVGIRFLMADPALRRLKWKYLLGAGTNIDASGVSIDAITTVTRTKI